MKLQAVTVCVNYSDFLECIAPNRRHFDRWVVVTVPLDRATVEVCERHGMEVIFTKALPPDGKGIHGLWHKSALINEGLEALDQEGWVVVIDSDVYLPRDFRERLSQLPLEAGLLYGVAGRKVCDEREAFEMLKAKEPWEAFLYRNSAVIGYFNLFHLESPINRYPLLSESEVKGAEDYLFYLKFAPDRWRYLPMTVLHVGKTYINWEGRVAPAYDLSPEAAGGSGSAGLAGVTKGSAAVIGYYPGMELPPAIAGCERVWLADHFLMHHPSGDPMIETDRATLRKLWGRQTQGMTNLHRIGIHSASNVARIPDASLDFLYLPGEAKPDWLVASLPHWSGKLKEGAVVCGDLYGLPHWPDSTYAIALLLGTPVEVASNGFWWGRMRSGLVRPPRVSEAGEREVILVNEGTADIERLLVTMHQVRQGWDGRMRLFHWGPENQGLRIAAARYGVEMIGVEPACEETSGVVAETLDAGLWPQAIYLPSGALVLGKVEELFSSAVEAAEFDPGKPWRMEGATKSRTADCHASNFEETTAVLPSVLLCTGAVETWTDAAWVRWSGALTAMTVELAAEIRVAADATVAILVGAREIDEFEQVWMTLKFAPAVPVIVGLIGIPGEDVWLAPTGREPQIVALSAEDSTRRQLAVLLASVQTERVILLPPNARPLPGAELFPEAEESGDAILHTPSFGIFRTEALRRLCAEESTGICAAADQGSTLGDPGGHVDMARKGWRFKEPPASAAVQPHPFDTPAFPV